MQSSTVNKRRISKKKLADSHNFGNTEIQVEPGHPGQPIGNPIQENSFHPPFLLIDTRRKDEYKESHIHGAINIHFLVPKFRVEDTRDFEMPSWVERDTQIITYCAVGLRSGMMSWHLKNRGYVNVKVMNGGFYKWVNEGRPIFSKTGDVAEKVLQQHIFAGLMLRQEVKLTKKQKEAEERARQMANKADRRIEKATHRPRRTSRRDRKAERAVKKAQVAEDRVKEVTQQVDTLRTNIPPQPTVGISI